MGNDNFIKNTIKQIIGDKKVAYLINMRDNFLLNYHFNYLTAFQKLRYIQGVNKYKVQKKKQKNTWENRKNNNAYSPYRNAKKPHLLLVTEKWCNCNQNYGISLSNHVLFGSLESSGLATQDRLHLDEFYYQYNQYADVALLQKCIESNPDLIVLTWIPLAAINPRLETLKLITTKLKIPIVAIWYESVSKSINMDIAEELLPVIKLNIVLDSTTAYLKATNHPEKYMPMWTPQDPRIFNNPGLERDIDISFVGSVNRENDIERQSGINALKSQNIVVFQAGGQRENRLSIDEYANIMKRSKISLNFSNVGYDNAGGSIVQCKGRVFETTLCGAMLLESENSETAKWFEPMVDYVTFKDSTDLVEKARYYLEHDSEREAIAARGHRKAMEKYSSEMFWKTVFNTVWNTKNDW